MHSTTANRSRFGLALACVALLTGCVSAPPLGDERGDAVTRGDAGATDPAEQSAFDASATRTPALASEIRADCPLAPDGESVCPPLNPDPSCTVSEANGSYANCPCPRPEAFAAPEQAPLCTEYGSPDGFTQALEGSPCTTEWSACIGMDPVAGTTPEGCVCLHAATEHQLLWFCGSTNKWFRLEGT
jgi:hypothetical protein